MSGSGRRGAPSLPRLREMGLDAGPCAACDGDGCAHCHRLGLVLRQPAPAGTPPGSWSRLAVQVPSLESEITAINVWKAGARSAGVDFSRPPPRRPDPPPRDPADPPRPVAREQARALFAIFGMHEVDADGVPLDLNLSA